MIRHLRYLYFLVLMMAFAVVTIALGGGLFEQEGPWILQWQHQAFAGLCHQISERSFWINGQPMAVCSRCFGIYVSFLAGWLLLPVIDYFHTGFQMDGKRILAATIFINLLDVVGNMLGFWQNTLISRMILGALIGSAAAALFAGSFFTITTKKTEEAYGGVPTTNTG